MHWTEVNNEHRKPVEPTRKGETTISKADLEAKVGVLLERISKVPLPDRSYHAAQEFGEAYNQVIDMANAYKPSEEYPEKVDIDLPWGGLPGRTWATYQQLEEYLQELQRVL